MPSLDTIRTLTLKATVDGYDEAAAASQKLADAQGAIAVSSDTATKSSLSASSAVDKLSKSLDPTYRATGQLQSAQTTLGKGLDQGVISLDRYNQLMALTSQRFSASSASANVAEKDIGKLSEVMAVIESRAVGASASMGMVGAVFQVVGPAGIAVGAAIGLAAAAFSIMSEKADELATKAQGLSTFAAVTGLTTDEIQALNETAAKFGVTTDTTQRFVDNFTAKLTELRAASGPLYDAILKVDAGIAQQMLTAKSTTEELDLFAKAYKEAAAAGNGNALLNAAGGRGSVTLAPVVGSIADAGGLNAMNAAMDQGARLAANLVTQLKDLKAQNDQLKDDIQNNIGSLFSAAILQNQVEARTEVVQITTALKDFKLSGDWTKFVDDIGKIATMHVPAWLSGGTGSIDFGQLSAGIPSQQGGSDLTGIDTRAGTVTSAPLAPVVAQPGQSPEATANQYKALVTVLGSAATITDQFNAKLANLVVAATKAGVPADQLATIQAKLSSRLDASGGAAAAFGKALDGLQQDKLIALQSAHNAALGEFATTQDLVNAKTLALAKSQQQGVGLTSGQVTAVKNLVAANDEWNRVNGQAQVGVFNLAAATKAAGDQFQSWIDKKYLDPSNPQQYAAAMQAMANKIKETSDAAAVAGSAFPQLTRLGLDAGNVNKQFDTFATGSLNNFSSALVSIANGSATAGDAFRKFGNQVVTALENMIIQMTIIKPLAQAFGGGFSGFNLFGAGATAAVTSAHGNVFDAGSVVRFAAGGIPDMVDSPTLAPMAMFGEAGPEAIMPLKRGADGSLGVATAGGKGGDTNIHYNIDASGADSGTVQRIQKVLQAHSQAIGAQGAAMSSAQYYQSTGVSR